MCKFISSDAIRLLLITLSSPVTSSVVALADFNCSLKVSGNLAPSFILHPDRDLRPTRVGRVRNPLDPSGKISVPNSPHGQRGESQRSDPPFVCPELFNFRLTLFLSPRNPPEPVLLIHVPVVPARGTVANKFRPGSPAMHIRACIRKIGGCQG